LKYALILLVRVRQIYIFEQKKEPNQHISGFAIGLNLCSKVKERHNGKTLVENQIDEGASFFFCHKLT